MVLKIVNFFIFCYHSVITSGCQDTRPATVFLFCSLLFLTLLYISTQQKNPGNLAVPGYLTFGHMYLAVLNIYNLRCYAKIIR